MAIGAAARGLSASPDDVVLDLGHHHPSTHGALRLRLRLDGDRDRRLRARGRVPPPRRGEALRGPRLPADHRARQPPRLAERVRQRARGRARGRADARHRGARPGGLAAHAAGRAQPGAAPPDVPRLLPGRARRGADLDARASASGSSASMEELTGGRMHYMFNRVGGLKEELPEGWLDRAAGGRGPPSAARCPGSRRPRSATRCSRSAPAASGCSTRPRARAHGVSGPVARASGLDLDLRRDEPYLAYGELADVLRVAGRTEGDAYAAVLGARRAGRAPASTWSTPASTGSGRCRPARSTCGCPRSSRRRRGRRTPGPRAPAGINGYYLVSRGEKTPWRLKLRTPGVQQRLGAAGAGRGRAGRGAGADARLDVLRHRRHRQVGRGAGGPGGPCPAVSGAARVAAPRGRAAGAARRWSAPPGAGRPGAGGGCAAAAGRPRRSGGAAGGWSPAALPGGAPAPARARPRRSGGPARRRTAGICRRHRGDRGVVADRARLEPHPQRRQVADDPDAGARDRLGHRGGDLLDPVDRPRRREDPGLVLRRAALLQVPHGAEAHQPGVVGLRPAVVAVAPVERAAATRPRDGERPVGAAVARARGCRR